jgi:hypothetical protein
MSPLRSSVPLYDTLYSLWPMSPLRHLPPLWSSVPLWSCVASTTLYQLYGTLPPLLPSIPSMALCPSSVFYPHYCPLYCPLYPQHLFPSLFPLRPFVLSTLLCLLYGPQSPLPPSEKQRYKRSDPSCFAKCFAKMYFAKHQGLSLIYSVSAIVAIITITRDYRSCEIISENGYDNSDYHIQQEAIIGFRGKMKSPFRLYHSRKTDTGRQVDLNTCSHKLKIVDLHVYHLACPLTCKKVYLQLE